MKVQKKNVNSAKIGELYIFNNRPIVAVNGFKPVSLFAILELLKHLSVEDLADLVNKAVELGDGERLEIYK